MIETIVLDYLSEALNAPAFMEVPENPPGEFVVVEKTGGPEEDHIKFATLAIQSYAASLYEAALLNESVKSAMDNLAALDVICRVSLNSDYNFTDTASKQYRYQAVFDLIYY